MSAVSTIPNHFVTEFGTNWLTLAQQKDSRLSGTVTRENVHGKEKRISQIGTSEMQRITGRAQDTRISDINTEQRWLTPYPHDDAKLFDKWDDTFLGEVVLPTSNTLQQMIAGYHRALDKAVIDAAVGDARTGVAGAGTTVLPNGRIIPVDFVESGTPANTGLTIGKLRQLKYLFDNEDVEDDDRVLVHAAKQLQDLLRSVEVGSHDYNDVRALIDGKISRFLGFEFKRVSSKLLPYNAGSDIRTVVAYQKQGVALSDTGLATHMDIRSDKSHALQIRIEAAFGATRLEEVRVATALCDESPA